MFGPFLSASQAVDTFAHGVYYSYLFRETLSEMLECERRLKEAIANDDDGEYIKNLQNEARHYDGMLQLTLAASSPLDYSEEA